MRRRLTTAAAALGVLLGGCTCSFALNSSVDINQYAHTSWTVRDGFSLGNIYAITQTPDGYLWLGTEFGLFRFDGVRSTAWQPPAGQHLPTKDLNSLLASRDGTVWIGTFAGLVTLHGGKLTSAYPVVSAKRQMVGSSLKGDTTACGWLKQPDKQKLTRPPALADQFVASLFEDREGTVWAGSLGNRGRLCAFRGRDTHCYGEDGAFGRAVWALYEDSKGTLWAAAESGLWRVKPGPPRRYSTRTDLIGLNKADDGRLLIAVHGAGLMQLVGDKVEPYPLRAATKSNRVFKESDVDSNRLLRDRDGGLWIGTVERGLIHVHHGRADVFTRSDGLSGDVILSVFEDREGNVWIASTGGLDRFRELPVSTISTKQGLFSDATSSVLAATDGSIWVGSQGGLTRWRDGQATTFSKADGLPDDAPQSLFQDYRGRIWVFTRNGPAYFERGKFIKVYGVPGKRVHFVAGDAAGNLWLSDEKGFLHLLDGHVVEQIPWSELGHRQSAEVLLFDPRQGGVWLGFWVEGGVAFFKDGQLRASYRAANGMGEGPVGGLQLDPDGTLWAATLLGGLSRIKDGRIATLTSRNGLPCDTVHWTVDGDDHSLWLYTACGLVRITRTELDAWIADPKHRVETTVWDATDGVKLRSTAAGEYGPRVAKATDGKIWFATGEGVQFVDPRHLALNKLLPPVHIEEIVADHKTYWQNLTGSVVSNLVLPPRTRDLQIDYTALSLVAPEKVHFKYKLEGQDSDWREVVSDRKVQYSNLPPRSYRFHVIACNNSGVWNEQGDTLEFTITPAFYQTNWFRALCAILVLALVWAIYQLRVRQLHQRFALTLEARVGERTSIARELHDTLLQSFQGLMPRFQAASQLLPARPLEAKEDLDTGIKQAAEAIIEGRDAVQGLRSSTVETNDLALAVNTLAEELAADSNNHGSAAIRVAVEGQPRDLHPILRDETYRIAAEALRNAFRHAHAHHIEVEIRYDDRQFCLRVRDDGKGIDAAILSGQEPAGHFGLPGMRERARLIGGRLAVWSELDAGTELELRIPAAAAYAQTPGRAWWSRLLGGKGKPSDQETLQ